MDTVETKAEAKESHVIYEVGYLLVSTLPEEKLSEVVAKLRSAIEDRGGSIISEEFPKMRALAYTIAKASTGKRQKFDHAYFGWIKFEVASEEIAGIKKTIEALEEILRALFIKTVRENTLISAKFAQREAQQKAKTEEGGTEAEKTPANEEEIDKSIDALVMN